MAFTDESETAADKFIDAPGSKAERVRDIRHKLSLEVIAANDKLARLNAPVRFVLETLDAKLVPDDGEAFRG